MEPAEPPPVVPSRYAQVELFDIQQPPFDKVLSDEPQTLNARQRWLPVIVFVTVVLVSVIVGLVILQQGGLLGVGVPLNPGLPLAPGSVT
jgi:hypothetical protein